MEKEKLDQQVQDADSQQDNVEENIDIEQLDITDSDDVTENTSSELPDGEKPIELIEGKKFPIENSFKLLKCDKKQIEICHGSQAAQNSGVKEVNRPKFDMPFIFGSSVIGPLHIQMNIPCQDANAYEVFSPEWSALAVADGLGSAMHSDIGAQTAVKAAIDYLRTVIRPEGYDNPPIDHSEIELPELAANAIRYAREQVVKVAECNKQALRLFASTLEVVVIHDREVAAAHIGDGAIVAQCENEMVLISDPGDSEYINEVVPLTTKNPEQHIRKSEIIHDVMSVSAFSDGNQRMALAKSEDGLKPFPGFFNPIFNFAKEQTDHQQAVMELDKFQKSAKMSEFSEDDKTMVIAVLVR